MKFSKRIIAGFALLAFLLYTPSAYAGVPLTNLEGVGGIALNPVAYLAGTVVEAAKERGNSIGDKIDGTLEKAHIAKPQVGSWYVHFGESKIDWATIGVADSFFNRLELSYGFETAALASGPHRFQNNVGAKLLLIPENWRGHKFIPAVSVGGIWKNTENAIGSKPNGFDAYVVATKLIDQLPVPLLLSGGALLTQGKATGLLGYDKKSAVAAFGNADLVVTKWLALGYEVKQGAKFKDFRNATYQDAHVAWMPNKNLTVVLAYVYGGATKKTAVGLGSGIVASLQYAF
jgi:hypothetical protein